MKVFIAGVLLCFAVCVNTQVRSNVGPKSMPNNRFGWEDSKASSYFDLSRYEPDVYFLVWQYSQYVNTEYNTEVTWINPIKQEGTWGSRRTYKMTVQLRQESDTKHVCNATYVTDYPFTYKNGQFTRSECHPPIRGYRG